MSAGFSQVYEQWLKESSKSTVSDGGDALYKDPDGLSELMDGDSSTDYDEDEEDQSHVSKYKRPLANAPILLDDDNEMSVKDKFQFDEPPILEPFSKSENQGEGQNKSLKKKLDSCTNFMSKKNRFSELKNTKSYKKNSDFKSLKYSDSDNLFDRFSTSFCRDEDNPPPLIPSPEALRLHSESPEREEKQPVKPQSSSPDFRAMEADSTSEVLKNSASNLKPSIAEHMECDSTCMLGTSPLLSFPTISNCVGELEIKDPGGTDLDADLPTEQSCSTASNRDVLQPSKDAECEHDHSEQERLCTNLLKSNKNIHSTSTDLSNLSKHSKNSLKSQQEPDRALSDEPPQLCLNSSESQKHNSLKCNNNKNNSVINSSLSWEIDNSGPPTLSCMSDEFVNPIIIRQSNSTKCVLTTKSKSSNHLRTLHQSKSKAAKIVKSSHSSNTFPITKMKYYANGLPEKLQQFVIASWQLSALQTSLHKLVKILFPPFKDELCTMSPESETFYQFLKDLFEFVQIGEMAESNQNNYCVYPDFYSPMDLTPSNSISTSKLGAPSISEPLHNNSDSSSLRRSTRHCSQKDSLNIELTHHLSSLQLENCKLCVKLKNTSVKDLKEYSIFICQLLQRLLPELAVDLCTTLADDIEGLVNFVNNVLISNGRRK